VCIDATGDGAGSRRHILFHVAPPNEALLDGSAGTDAWTGQ